MSIWDRLRKKKTSPAPVEWQEIKVAETPLPGKKGLNKSLLAVFSGKVAPLEAQPILAEFLEQGWPTVFPLIDPLVRGKTHAMPWVLGEVFAFFPQESADAYLPIAGDIPRKNLFMLVNAVGSSHREEVAALLVSLAASLEPEDIPTVLELLGKYPSAEGNKYLAHWLQGEDWRLAVKAAAALETAGAVDYLPQMVAARSGGGILADSLDEIIQRMS